MRIDDVAQPMNRTPEIEQVLEGEAGIAALPEFINTGDYSKDYFDVLNPKLKREERFDGNLPEDALRLGSSLEIPSDMTSCVLGREETSGFYTVDVYLPSSCNGSCEIEQAKDKWRVRSIEKTGLEDVEGNTIVIDDYKGQTLERGNVLILDNLRLNVTEAGSVLRLERNIDSEEQ